MPRTRTRVRTRTRRRRGRGLANTPPCPGWWWAYCTAPCDENDEPLLPTEEGHFPVVLPSGQAVYIQSDAVNPHGAATFRPVSFFNEARVANRDTVRPTSPNAADFPDTPPMLDTSASFDDDLPRTPPSADELRCSVDQTTATAKDDAHSWFTAAAPWVNKLGCAPPPPASLRGLTSEEDEEDFLFDLSMDALCLDVTIDVEHDTALAGEVTLATVHEFVQQPAHLAPKSDSSASDTLSLCSDCGESGGEVLSKRERRRQNRQLAEQQRKDQARQQRRQKQQKHLAKREAKLHRRATRQQHATTTTTVGFDEVDLALRDLGLLDAGAQPCVAA